MNQISKTSGPEDLEWLYAHSRNYPLLSAEQERNIDEGKWQTRDVLLETLLADARGRLFLAQWVENLLYNPPNLKVFLDKEHYYVLRREQSDLVKDAEKLKLLKRLHKLLGKTHKLAGKDDSPRILAQLELSPLLVAGFADIQLSSSDSGEIVAALRYWRKFWTESNTEEVSAKELPVCNESRQVIRRQLKAFFNAREQLVNHNLRLVFAIAGKMKSTAVPYMDRVQSGMLGLIRAAEKYDSRTGHRFSTYAYNWINQSSRRMLEDQRSIVRLPSDVNEQVNRLYRESLAHLNATGEDPSINLLADRLQIEPDAVARLQQTGNLSISLDSPFSSDPDGLTLGDTLSDMTYSPPAAKAEQASLNSFLISSLKGLAPQERSVVTLRWGLDDSPPLSRRELADYLTVSTERIRQLEMSALGKLRNTDGVAEAFSDYQMRD
ncbi:MAG: sigma-70 family RNA polymerase sigma factor [Halioglobus sp.]|nr:sigma-70 family RNA polymerase sigma factor [Halioglobus sp.]